MCVSKELRENVWLQSWWETGRGWILQGLEAILEPSILIYSFSP